MGKFTTQWTLEDSKRCLTPEVNRVLGWLGFTDENLTGSTSITVRLRGAEFFSDYMDRLPAVKRERKTSAMLRALAKEYGITERYAAAIIAKHKLALAQAREREKSCF